MGGREIVIPVLFIEMRRLEIVCPGFEPTIDRAFEMIISRVEDIHLRADQLRLFQVDLLQVDLSMSCPFFILRRVIALVVDLPIFVKKKGGIDTGRLHPDECRPRTTWIAGGGDEVAPRFTGTGACQRTDYVEQAIVIADGWRIEPAATGNTVEVKVCRVGENMTDHAPCDQVTTVPDRQPGKVFVAAGDDVVVVARPADRRVGVEAGDDGLDQGRCPVLIIALKLMLGLYFND